MAKCYVCEQEIDNTNKSDEHIFLNSIGGKLKSTEIICRDCNSKFGADIDFELSKQLNPISNMLDVKRDRGAPQSIEVNEKNSGEKWLLDPGGKPVMAAPSIHKEDNGNQVQFQVIARSMHEARQIIKGFKKKYPKIDVDEELKKASLQREYMDEHFEFVFHVGGEKAFRSICKTSVNFYILNGGERGLIAHLIPYIKDGQGNGCVWFYMGENIIQKEPEQIVHAIVLKAIEQEKVLFAYIELFNAFRFIVLLNDDYIGASYQKSYVFDVLKREEVFPKVNINLNKSSVCKILSNQERPDKAIEQELMGLMPLIMKKQESDHIDRMLQRALDNSLKKYPEGVPITEEMINELVNAITEEITPWIIHNFGEKD